MLKIEAGILCVVRKILEDHCKRSSILCRTIIGLHHDDADDDKEDIVTRTIFLLTDFSTSTITNKDEGAKMSIVIIGYSLDDQLICNTHVPNTASYY